LGGRHQCKKKKSSSKRPTDLRGRKKKREEKKRLNAGSARSQIDKRKRSSEKGNPNLLKEKTIRRSCENRGEEVVRKGMLQEKLIDRKTERMRQPNGVPAHDSGGRSVGKDEKKSGAPRLRGNRESLPNQGTSTPRAGRRPASPGKRPGITSTNEGRGGNNEKKDAWAREWGGPY